MDKKITVQEIASYIRLTEMTSEEKSLIEKLIKIAEKFIRDYTGVTEEEFYEHEDFKIVVYILCEDMFDNRTLYVDKTNLNKVVKSILDMHDGNLI